jgi:cobalamin synthase
MARRWMKPLKLDPLNFPSKVLKDHISWKKFALATLIALILAGVLFKMAGVVIMAGIWLVITLVSIYLKRQLKGLTGDTYGTINEVAFVSIMIMVTMLAFNNWLL